MAQSEIITASLAILFHICLFAKISKKERIPIRELCVLAAGIAPVVFYSVNMVSDTITVDEIHYMRVIVDMKHILDHPAMAEKLMLQYRFSQMVFGTLFMLIPRAIFQYLPQTILIILYKLLHWLLFYCIGLLMACIVYKKYLKQTGEAWKNILAWIVTADIITGLPMAISIMKVCNYDASNVMFGTSGILLAGVEVTDSMAGKRKGSFKYGWLGMLCCVFGCLDKWSCGIYFIICAVLCCFAIVIRKDGTVKAKIKAAVIQLGKILIASFFVGYINLEYIRLVLAGGKLFSEIRFGHVAFSFVNLFLILFEESGGAARVSVYAAVYILLLYVAIIVTALLFGCFYDYMCKLLRGGVQRRICCGFLSAAFVFMIISGIYGAYFVPQMMAPYDQLKEGEYYSKVVWGSYHYGAYSWLGHKVSQIVYAFATVVCNFPAGILFLFGIVIVLLWTRKDTELFYPIVIDGCIAVIMVLACMNQPSDPRYFGVPIYLMSLSAFAVFFNGIVVPYGKEGRSKKYLCTGVITAFALCMAELAFYIPNIKIFAPAWYVHSKEWKQTVRLGYWYAGEAMSWGEELALAGRKIKQLTQESGMEPGEVTIYVDYGSVWLKNPGFKIKAISSKDPDMRFDDTSYFVLTKKKLFRTVELPLFLDTVEPAAAVAYRGEICSWIYSGSQLADYKDYFGIQDHLQ